MYSCCCTTTLTLHDIVRFPNWLESGSGNLTIHYTTRNWTLFKLLCIVPNAFLYHHHCLKLSSWDKMIILLLGSHSFRHLSCIALSTLFLHFILFPNTHSFVNFIHNLMFTTSNVWLFGLSAPSNQVYCHWSWTFNSIIGRPLTVLIQHPQIIDQYLNWVFSPKQ